MKRGAWTKTREEIMREEDKNGCKNKTEDKRRKNTRRTKERREESR